MNLFDLLFFLSTHLTVRESCDMFAISTCFAHLVFFSDCQITLTDVMSHRAFIAYECDSTMFLNVFVFLTVKALL